MLAKSHKTQASHKKEVAEKVKEIKQRQQNWFKQREQSKQNSPAHQGNLLAKTQTKDKDHFAPTQHVSNRGSTTINRQTVTVKNSKLVTNGKEHGSDKAAGFHAWRSRQTQHLTGSEETQEETDSDYAETESTDIPVYSDVESYRSEVQSRAMSSPADTGGGGTLSPDQFDALADQIITRVKKELYVDTSSSSVQNHRQNKKVAKYEEKKYSLRNDDPPDNIGLDSHICPSCSALMMPPKFEPMLVIPCGHTLCCQCLKGQSTCPLCGCDINSLTCNIMLQQIIIDYKNKPRISTGGQKNEFKTKYSIGGASAQVDNSESDKKYEEEYRTLRIRCEVLKAEEDSINERILGFKQKVKQEQVQIESIAKEEKRVEDQIDELRHKLEALRVHRGDYIEKCKGIERKGAEEERKLKLCQDTLIQLQKDAEKIKHMAGKLDLDNSF